MDLHLKRIRQKLSALKKATEKPYEYNPERYWESEPIQWSNYQDNLENLKEAEKELFEYLKSKKSINKPARL